eukprot:RCo027186
MGYTYFIIVGKGDQPVYEVETFDSKHILEKTQLKQFITNAALDPVDEAMWTTTAFYLKVVDRFNDFYISAYVTPGCTRFLIMQDSRQEESVKSFFHDVYDLYLKVLLNPFYDPNVAITSPQFDSRVRALLKKYF